jgi:hypothetical protein
MIIESAEDSFAVQIPEVSWSASATCLECGKQLEGRLLADCADPKHVASGGAVIKPKTGRLVMWYN